MAEFFFPPQIIYLFNFLSPFLNPVWLLIKAWWWLPLPFILWRPFKFLWGFWRHDLWYKKKVKMIMLEIKIPKEVLKPMRAMELVMSSLWQIIYKPPDWWETWIDGEFQLSYSFEIVSIGGDVHFFIRTPDDLRNAVESAIYSQYPEAEITLAEDYTRKVPQDIPNKDWNIWASDYRFLKPNPYPIKTYKDFETEHEAKEEKRIDPLSVLLEGMAKIKPGEQLWVQIKAKPVSDAELPWVTEGEKIRDKIARRTPKEIQRKPLIVEAFNALVLGEVPAEPKMEKEVMPPEMKLTPGERDVISKVEEKIAKPGFEVNIRFAYIGERDVFYTPNIRLAFSYFAAFSTQNCNTMVPWGETLTKIKKSRLLIPNLTIDRRLYLRKRQIFRRYLFRLTPKYPLSGGTFVLNIEELATVFHFPGWNVSQAPFIKRVESKRGEAPFDLPTG